MNDLVDIEVAEALATLRKRYPDQNVSIRVWSEPNKPVEFWASVEHRSSPMDREMAAGDSAHKAVEQLIAKCGERTLQSSKQKRIAQLREELRALGAEPMGDNEPAQPHERCGMQ